MKSSLTLQMLLHLGAYLEAVYAAVILLIMLYKAIVLPYPLYNFLVEFLVLVALSLCESLRLFLSWKGNLTEKAKTMVMAIVFLIPGVLGVTFFLIWQTYILRLEMIFSGVVLTMQGLQLIFSLICVVTFSASSD